MLGYLWCLFVPWLATRHCAARQSDLSPARCVLYQSLSTPPTFLAVCKEVEQRSEKLKAGKITLSSVTRHRMTTTVTLTGFPMAVAEPRALHDWTGMRTTIFFSGESFISTQYSLVPRPINQTWYRRRVGRTRGLSQSRNRSLMHCQPPGRDNQVTVGPAACCTAGLI